MRDDLRHRWRALAPRGAVVLAFGLGVTLLVESRWLEVGLAKAAEPWGWFMLYGFPRNHFAGIQWAIAYFVGAALALALAVSWTHTRWDRALRIAIPALAAADLGFALHSPFLHPASDSSPARVAASCYDKVPAIAGELGRHLSFRLPGLLHALKDKDGELFTLYSATHYDPLVTHRQAAYFAALEEGSRPFMQSPWSEQSPFMGFLRGTPTRDRAKLLDLLGTGAILADARASLRPPGLSAFLERYPRVDRCHAVVEGTAIPIDLYANPNALPRAFVVHRLTVVESTEQALRRLVEPDFDPRQEAVIEASLPPLSSGSKESAASVEIRSYEPTRVAIHVETPKPGLLVLTDSYDPDWKARLGGQAVEIYPTDGLFRGVAVPAGRWEVVFRYRPHHFYWGAAISVATLVLAAILWIRADNTRQAGKRSG
jgi:hypothetical protein